MPTRNPLDNAAQTSLDLSKGGDRQFKIMAFVFMGISGVVAMLHSLHMIYRDLVPKRGKENDKPERAYQPPRPDDPEEPHHYEGEASPVRSWVTKARVGDRPDGGEKAWAERHGQPAHARQH